MSSTIKHNIYLIGIGGIGMSAIARYFMFNEHKVYGYDRTETTLTKTLCEEGATIVYNDEVTHLQELGINQNDWTLIYTPAISVSNKIRCFFETQGYNLFKRSDILGMLTETCESVCVAGTHGKTTISTMTGYFLNNTGVACNAFLGGISVNSNSNINLSPSSNITVVEADEYDRTFLKLNPNIAVLSSVDADHLDIYSSNEGVLEGFQQFIDLIPETGALIVHENVSIRPKNKAVKVLTYGMSNSANCYPSELALNNGRYTFTLNTPMGSVENLSLLVPGLLNVENAIAALTVCILKNANVNLMQWALESYKGIKRRFEVHKNTTERVYIDDYAHHPSEINKTLHAIKMLYPKDKVAIAFQPHLYSRTQDFVGDFAAELDKADEVFLMDIYAARELPIQGVSSQLIAEKMKTAKVELVSDTEVAEKLCKSTSRIMVTMGAGDIDLQVKKIVNNLK